MTNTVIVFAGEYDLACKDQLRDEFLSVQSEPSLVLDLSEVSYVDSSFVTQLLRLHQYRHASTFATETIVLRHPMLRRLFAVLGLQSTFRLVDTLDEAIGTNGEVTSIRYAFSGTTGLEEAPLPY